jgi:dTDP-4-amino-4,6-dideoxygalactose transaminase
MSAPDITEDERRAVDVVLKSPVLSMGAETAAFERAIQEYSGARQAIAVNSGTAGLHLCVRAAGIGSGDLVLTTPFSFVASSNVLLYEGSTPVFVDAEMPSGNIDVSQVAQAAADLAAGGQAAKRWLPPSGAREGAALKAILAVDVFGQPADYDALRKIADEYGLKVIEDSCESIGAQYKGRLSGCLGDFGVYAFYPNKQMTTGEGGVIVTDDESAADTMRALRNQGRAPGDTWLEHTYLGYNYRLTEMSAALGRVQLERLEELLNKREQVAAWYKERLAPIGGVEAPVRLESTTRMSWFVYVIRLAESIDRDKLIAALDADGIPVRPYFSPIHLQPFMRQQFGYQEGSYPVTEDLGRRGLALPFSSVMTQTQVELVCASLAKAL